MQPNQPIAIADAFQHFILNPAFPCVGAKSALAKKQIDFFVANDITTSHEDNAITQALQRFASHCGQDSLFVSFAVIFQNSKPMNEIEFEHNLWQRLQSIHEHDLKHYDWDGEVSNDPESPDFSMSVGGKAFYVVGLHPGSSRPARRFSAPALVFNLHSQFELLREEGSYTNIRETILERDRKINGSVNPMLAAHGESSEARQYSGRQIEQDWKCPFRFLHRKKS